MADTTPNSADAPEAVNPVRRAREALGLTREGLAFKAGVAVRTVDRIESGEVRPHRATQRTLAKVLGVGQDELFPSGAPTSGAAA